jgi:hypothetical protein
MKTFGNLSRQFVALISAILFSSLILISCSKDDNNTSVSGMYAVSGSANGAQAVPSITGTATGNISGTYNANTNLLTYNITWTGLTGSATTSTFYTGATGVNGNLVSNTTITTMGATGASAGTMTLTDAQETALLNGTWYYVIGTTAHASGEIRGQITTTVQ